MATNPHPAHITAEYWWFIEALESLESADTVFAGAWGRNKPGGHCDAYGLWWHKDPKTGLYTWRDDYTLRHPDDKVLGTPLEQYGAATDWTFLSAQRGDFRNISKYGRRIAVAFANRDPRLKGWHEVLIQADMDKAPEGFNFRSWTTRVPDTTHEWHGHFTCSRKYLRTLSVFQAMISILKGETLAQWLAGGGDDDMPKAIWTTKGYWLCQGGKREPINDADDMAKVTEVYGNVCWPKADVAGFPTPQVDLPVSQGGRGWSWDEIDRLLGRPYEPATGGVAGGVSMADVHDAISNTTLTPPA